MFKIANYGARHDRMSMIQDDFMSMPIPYPTDKEQNLISEFLLSLDTYISLIKDQYKQAKAWENGLLQQMFV
jgi:type I restriction enzyme S subunit